MSGQLAISRTSVWQTKSQPANAKLNPKLNSKRETHPVQLHDESPAGILHGPTTDNNMANQNARNPLAKT